jgi:hypothetical protein
MYKFFKCYNARLSDFPAFSQSDTRMNTNASAEPWSCSLEQKWGDPVLCRNALLGARMPILLVSAMMQSSLLRRPD